MEMIYPACYLMLAVGFILTLYRLIAGPTVYDRIIALDLVSALIMCSLGVYAVQSGQYVFFDVILAIALIAFLGTVAFARYLDTAEQKARNPRPASPANPASEEIVTKEDSSSKSNDSSSPASST